MTDHDRAETLAASIVKRYVTAFNAANKTVGSGSVQVNITDLVSELISTTRQEAQEAQRAADLDWVLAHKRDCGCADNIAESIRTQEAP